MFRFRAAVGKRRPGERIAVFRVFLRDWFRVTSNGAFMGKRRDKKGKKREKSGNPTPMGSHLVDVLQFVTRCRLTFGRISPTKIPRVAQATPALWESDKRVGLVSHFLRVPHSFVMVNLGFFFIMARCLLSPSLSASPISLLLLFLVLFSVSLCTLFVIPMVFSFGTNFAPFDVCDTAKVCVARRFRQQFSTTTSVGASEPLSPRKHLYLALDGLRNNSENIFAHTWAVFKVDTFFCRIGKFRKCVP